MSEVETALRLDPRIGQKAYVRAGSAFGGGTLARDLQFLKATAKDRGVRVTVLPAVLESNDHHKGWVLRHLRAQLKSLTGKRIGILGIAYKAGTDAIRRSVAIEVIQALIADGADLAVFDPKVSQVPEPLNAAVSIAGSADAVFENADAVVLAIDWPEFRQLNFHALVPRMQRKLLIDQNSFAAKELSGISGLDYIVAGRMR
jgi:UDPglucose 6-dehydrogenase